MTVDREQTGYPFNSENLGTVEEVNSKQNYPGIHVGSNGSQDLIDSLKKIEENFEKKISLFKSYVDQVRDDIKKNLENLQKHDTNGYKGVDIQSSGSAITDIKYSTPKGLPSAKEEIIDEIKRLFKICNICEENNSYRKNEHDEIISVNSLVKKIDDLDKKITKISSFGHKTEKSTNSFDPR